MPQAPLSSYEMSEVPIGNQHTKTLTLIEYQALKGFAAANGVRDWLSEVDFSLTYEENRNLLRKKATKGRHGPTMRELKYLLR